MSNDPKIEQQLENMRRDWDARARENARHYVATGRDEWTDDEFFASGEKAVAEEILTDMINICQGRDPASMRVLEIGCGAGRHHARAFPPVWRGAPPSISARRWSRRRAGRSPAPPTRSVSEQRLRPRRGSGRSSSISRFRRSYSAHPQPRRSSRTNVSRSASPAAARRVVQIRRAGRYAHSTPPEETWLGVSYSDAEAGRDGRTLRF